MISNMNYFPVTLLTLLFCAQHFGIPKFSCTALILNESGPCKDPTIACEEEGYGVLVYNPVDCHQSYACIRDSSGEVVPSDYPLTCADGFIFDYETQNCSSEITSCNKACIITDTCKDPLFACEEQGYGALVYNPADCHQSYACIRDSSGEVVPSDYPLTCTGGLVFDYESQNCSSDTTSCDRACIITEESCKDPADACKEQGYGALVYNPEDCHQSYACIEDSFGNVVPSDYPFNCSDGLIFDYENQTCSPETTLCDKACINTGCVFECTKTFEGYVADPDDCNIYYFCYHGTKSSPSRCPESNPYFYGLSCTDKEYLCCDAFTAYD